MKDEIWIVYVWQMIILLLCRHHQTMSSMLPVLVHVLSTLHSTHTHAHTHTHADVLSIQSIHEIDLQWNVNVVVRVILPKKMDFIFAIYVKPNLK